MPDEELPDDLRDALTTTIQPYLDDGWRIKTGRTSLPGRVAITATTPTGSTHRANFDENEMLPSTVAAFLSSLTASA